MKYSMKMILVVAVTAVSAIAHAEEAKFTVKEMRETFAVTAQVLVLSDDGKRLVQPVRDTRKWQGMKNGEFRQDWSSQSSNYGDLRIRQNWKIDDHGNLSVVLEEFKRDVPAKDGSGPEFLDSAGKTELEVDALAPVVYRSKVLKNVAIRFVPDFEVAQAPRQLSGQPLVTHDATLFDSEGDVWAYDLDSEEEFVGFKTRMGTLALSFSKFDGAQPLGVASGQKITVKGEGTPTLVLQSRGAIVPEGISAVVYVRVLPYLKSGRLRSVNVFESTDRSRFEARLKKPGSI